MPSAAGYVGSVSLHQISTDLIQQQYSYNQLGQANNNTGNYWDPNDDNTKTLSRFRNNLYYKFSAEYISDSSYYVNITPYTKANFWFSSSVLIGRGGSNGSNGNNALTIGASGSSFINMLTQGSAIRGGGGGGGNGAGYNSAGYGGQGGWAVEAQGRGYPAGTIYAQGSYIWGGAGGGGGGASLTVYLDDAPGAAYGGAPTYLLAGGGGGGGVPLGGGGQGGLDADVTGDSGQGAGGDPGYGGYGGRIGRFSGGPGGRGAYIGESYGASGGQGNPTNKSNNNSGGGGYSKSAMYPNGYWNFINQGSQTNYDAGGGD